MASRPELNRIDLREPLRAHGELWAGKRAHHYRLAAAAAMQCKHRRNRNDRETGRQSIIRYRSGSRSRRPIELRLRLNLPVPLPLLPLLLMALSPDASARDVTSIGVHHHLSIATGAQRKMLASSSGQLGQDSNELRWRMVARVKVKQATLARRR